MPGVPRRRCRPVLAALCTAGFANAALALSADEPESRLPAKFGIEATKTLVRTLTTGIGEESATIAIEPAPKGIAAPAASERIDWPIEPVAWLVMLSRIATMM